MRTFAYWYLRKMGSGGAVSKNSFVDTKRQRISWRKLRNFMDRFELDSRMVIIHLMYGDDIERDRSARSLERELQSSLGGDS